MSLKALSLIACIACAASLRILPETKRAPPKCQAFNGKRVVLVNANKEYVDTGILYNWYHFAKEHIKTANAQLVIDIPNNEIHDLLKIEELADDVAIIDDNQELSTVADQRKSKQFSKIDKEEAPFGSDGFKKLTGKRRLIQAKSLLKRDCAVLQVDIDTAWKANVFADIDAMGDHQLVLTDDSRQGHGEDITQAKKWYLCTCFMYMQPELADDSNTFFPLWAQKTKEQKFVEQYGLNELLRDHVLHKGLSKENQNPKFTHLDWVVLPFKHYNPGPKADDENSHIIHANYVVGYARKIKLLKHHHVWAKETDAWVAKNGNKKFYALPAEEEIQFVDEPTEESA